MSLYASPEAHNANPPSTWRPVKLTARSWALRDARGVTLDTFPTRAAAIEATRSGTLVSMWERERRWYAGESVPGWRPCADVAPTT